MPGLSPPASAHPAALRPFLSPMYLVQFPSEILNLFLQRDHLEFTAYHHFLELLQIQNLLLQLGLRCLQVAYHLLIGAHVAQNADGADNLPVRVAQRRGVECRRNHFVRGAARVQPGIARGAALDHLAQGSEELSRLFGADKARERLLQHLVWTEAEQLVDRVIRLQDFSFQVRDEHRVRRVLNQAVRVRQRLIQFAHVAQNADGADDLPIRVTQRRGVQTGWYDLARGTAGIQARIADDTALDHLAQGSGKLSCLFGADKARERLLQHLVGAKAQQFVDRIVGRENLAFQVRDEHRVRRVLDDDIGVERTMRLGTGDIHASRGSSGRYNVIAHDKTSGFRGDVLLTPSLF